MDFESKKDRFINIRVSESEFKKIKEVCEYNNISYGNLFRSLFKRYYDELEEVRNIK